MAGFTLSMPEEIIRDIENIESNSKEIFGAMTRAGAETVYKNVKANMPSSLKSSNFQNCLKISKTYVTPSDDGINTKVMISGYFVNHNGKKTPAPLVANVFEYGRRGSEIFGAGKLQKRPFFRKSFKKSQIEKAMYKKQRELSGGLLEDE